MKKTMMKLSAAAVMVLLAVIMVVVSTFAWYSLSGSPEIGGIQLNIGGGGTIQIAADMRVVTEDGVLHYPGTFSDSLNFSQYATYDYLQDVVSLTPVSTADGVHWFFPDRSGNTSEDFGGYLLDDSYSYANLSTLPDDDSLHGSYVMLDFWVMAPTDCSLRVSYGDEEQGSYVVTLPYPQQDADGDYTMPTPDSRLPACMRVGFLADTRTQTDDSLGAYLDSAVYNDKVTSLRGVYGESGEAWDFYPRQFTIYEPSADVHSGDSVYSETPSGAVYRPCEDGSYVTTYPIGYVDGKAQCVDVTDRTTSQSATKWLEDGDSLLIQQLFETYMLDKEGEPRSLLHSFCSDYLGYRADAYIDKGYFVSKTDTLQEATNSQGVVSKDNLDKLTAATATDDVVIVELEKNVPQRIRMFIWIEGQDVDCSNVINEAGLMINLELAGSND